MELIARTKYEEQYIAISAEEYGKFVIVWCDNEMNILSYALLSHWIQITTHYSELEKGSWIVPDVNYNVFLEEDDSFPQFPVKVEANVINISDNFMIVNLVDTDIVYIGIVDDIGNFVGNIYDGSPPCNINGETTIEVWESLLKNNPSLSYYKKNLYFRNGLPNPITKLEKLAINRLLEDNISNYFLLDAIHEKENSNYHESLECPVFFLDHDKNLFNLISNSITKGDYSLLYSLIYKIPTIDRYNSDKTKERCTYSYYSNIISYFVYKMSNEELEYMFKNAKILDMNSIIYIFTKSLYRD